MIFLENVDASITNVRMFSEVYYYLIQMRKVKSSNVQIIQVSKKSSSQP